MMEVEVVFNGFPKLYPKETFKTWNSLNHFVLNAFCNGGDMNDAYVNIAVKWENHLNVSFVKSICVPDLVGQWASVVSLAARRVAMQSSVRRRMKDRLSIFHFVKDSAISMMRPSLWIVLFAELMDLRASLMYVR